MALARTHRVIVVDSRGHGRSARDCERHCNFDEACWFHVSPVIHLP